MTDLTRREAALGLAATALAVALPARAAARHAVAIANFSFDPQDMQIAVGDSVVFTNADGAPHTATEDNGAFDTGRLGKGGSAEVTFAAAGEFHYHCEFHRHMTAVIRVG